MDTDDLSVETYKAVFFTAESYHHNLTLQFGLLASIRIDDDDYLREAKELINYWRSDLDDGLEEIFFDVPIPTKSSFLKVLGDIEEKIELTIAVPIGKRNFDR